MSRYTYSLLQRWTWGGMHKSGSKLDWLPVTRPNDLMLAWLERDLRGASGNPALRPVTPTSAWVHADSTISSFIYLLFLAHGVNAWRTPYPTNFIEAVYSKSVHAPSSSTGLFCLHRGYLCTQALWSSCWCFSRSSPVKLRVQQGLGPGYKVTLAHGKLII
jgi:hypothetical protein